MLRKILTVTFMLGFCFSEIIHPDSTEDYEEYLNHGVRKVLGFKESSQEERKIDVLAKVFKKNFGLLKMESLKLDIVFLIDASSSVGESNFQSELKFVKKVLSDVTVDANNTRIAVVTFSSPNNVIKNIDEIGTTAEENNKCKLLNQDLKEVSYQGGQTFTLGAFEVAKDIFISSTRSDSQKVLFLVTDGYSNGGDPTPLAKELKIQNITIFTIGIQNGNYKELFEISSPPGQFHSYLLDSFSDFESLARKALHADLTSGEYIPTSNYKLCDHLCKTGHCCDINAICTCGTSTGHYTCLCQQGFYGSGLRNSCFPCESGTYSEGPNECLPCPDPNHMTIYPAFSIDDCKCKEGYISKEGGCEEITCPDFAMPENSYLIDSINCSNKVNGVCEIRCEVGYDLIGESKLVCQNNGMWSYTGLRCKAQKCNKLEPPKDGIMDCIDTNTGKDYLFDKENMQVPIDVTCSFRCKNGKILIGSEKRTCIPPGKWDGIKSLCKHIKCNKLPEIKYGTISPPSCLDGKQEVGKVCKISCEEGFKLRGPAEKRCVGGYGKWDSDFSTSICIDTEPPKMACPDNRIGTTLPGKMFGHVFWKEPVVTDNSGLNISIWLKPAITNIASFKFQIGTTEVAYYAQDAFQNRAQCSFKVIIKDEEPPTIEGCIDPPPFLTTGSEGVNVTWDEPHIFDNSQKVQVEKSREFGYFEKGTTAVVYTAKDPSHNRNICRLNITVEESACEALADPENGQSDCTGNNGHMRCIVTCDEGYGIPIGQPEEVSDGADNNFVCETNNDLIMYANDDPLYPECTVTVVPEDEFGEGEIDLDVDDCNDEKELNEKIKKVALSLNGYCGGGCDIDTSLSNCYDGDSTKLFKRSINYQPVPHRNKKQKGKLNVKFQVRGRYVNENGIGNLTLRLPGGYNATIRHFEKKFICPRGFAPRKNRCVQCPKGSFLNTTRSKCQSCDFGQYNDKLGQESCTVCPLHYSTMKIHSKKIADCKGECPPGSHARRKRFRPSKSKPNEVIERLTLQPNCRSCAIGFYQSQYGQLRCIACPSGYTTFAVGARDSTQCVATAKEMCRVHGICGYGLCIEINEYQYSCNCFQNYIGTNCEIRENYCDSNPCYNGGTCSNEDKGFKCKCRYRFRGKYCEEEDDCNRTCLNGGKCVQDDSGSPMCICSPGYTGKVCETKIKHCKSDLCSNSSKCVEEYGTFKCQCVSGFVGRRCNLLPCDFRPCSEQRRCINLMGSSSSINNYRCLCPDGYTGEDCNELIDACKSSNCVNGGLCINYVYYYKCECPGLYTGPHCEHKKRTNYVLSFEQYETHNYVKLDGFRGNISEVTACMWMYTPDNFNYGTLISYANRKFDNAFALTDYTGLVIYINNNYVVTDVLLNDAVWHHICVTWNSVNGSYKVYLEGNLVKSGDDLSSGTVIEGLGSMVIGQDQDAMGGKFSQSETFIGKMAYVDIWSKSLPEEDIQKHFNDCNDSIFGDVYAWPKMQDNIKGNIKIENSTFCLKCPQPRDVPNGYVHVLNNVAHYSCRKGFQLSSARYSEGRRCTKASKWEDNIEPYCRRIYCGYPGHIRNGYPLGNKFYFRDKVTYRCYEGFNMIGDESVTCMEDNKWYPSRPKCIGLQCPPFQKPALSEIEILSDQSYENYNENVTFDVGTQIEFTCNPKTNMTGQNIMTCLEDGTWDIQPPKCIPEKSVPSCPVDKVPPPPENGVVVQESLYSVGNGSGNAVAYTCNQGYRLQGTNISTCITDGYWTVPNISCEAITCEKPQVPKNVMLTDEQRVLNKFKSGHVLTFKCEDGYTIFGNGSIRCLQTGKWTRMQGRCIKKSCRKPNVSSKTVVQGKSYLYGDKVKIKCPSGSTYDLTCNKQGIWEGKKDSTC